MIIWQATKGRLRALFEANFQDDEKLVSEECPAEMIKLVKATFHEYLEEKVAAVFEEVIYDKETHRKKGETMSLYLQRKQLAWQKLKKAKIELPKELLGYMTLRDAHLSDRAWDAFPIWTKNEIDHDTIVDNLRKLDRPTMGKPGQTTTLFTDHDQETYAVMEHHAGEEEAEEEDFADATPMPCSLYITPENFYYDDDLTNAIMNDDTLDNDDVVMVAGDIPENHIFEEDDAVAVCANWSQVRQFLHKEKNEPRIREAEVAVHQHQIQDPALQHKRVRKERQKR